MAATSSLIAAHCWPTAAWSCCNLHGCFCFCRLRLLVCWQFAGRLLPDLATTSTVGCVDRLRGSSPTGPGLSALVPSQRQHRHACTRVLCVLCCWGRGVDRLLSCCGWRGWCGVVAVRDACYHGMVVCGAEAVSQRAAGRVLAALLAWLLALHIRLQVAGCRLQAIIVQTQACTPLGAWRRERPCSGCWPAQGPGRGWE